MLNSKSFLVDGELNRDIYSTKYNAAMEGNEFVIHAHTHKNLGSSCWAEQARYKKAHMAYIHLFEILEQAKLTHNEDSFWLEREWGKFQAW